MNDQIIEIRTKDGAAPCHFFSSEDGQKRPAAIIYMDAFGIREALLDMAGRLASGGYRVLLPDLYYRSELPRSFDPKTAFAEGPGRYPIRSMFTSLSNRRVMEDTGSFLEFLRGHPSVDGRKIGCVGYCMGGAMALSAAGTSIATPTPALPGVPGEGERALCRLRPALASCTRRY